MAERRQRGTNRIKASQVLDSVSFLRKSEFGAVCSEAGNRLSAVAGILGDVIRENTPFFGDAKLEPIRAPDSRSNEVVGQSVETATTNLANRQVSVAAVKPYDPRRLDVNLVRGTLRSVPAGSNVEIYEHKGVVKGYRIIAPEDTRPGEPTQPPIDRGRIDRLEGDVGAIRARITEFEGVKAELDSIKAAPDQGDTELARAIATVGQREQVITQLQADLVQVREDSAEKDRRIESVQGELDSIKAAPDQGDTELAKAIATVKQREQVIAQLQAGLVQVRDESQEKDRQIATIRNDLQRLDQRHKTLSEKVSPERLEKMEKDIRRALARGGRQ